MVCSRTEGTEYNALIEVKKDHLKNKVKGSQNQLVLVQNKKGYLQERHQVDTEGQIGGFI